MITREEFETGYCQRSGKTLAEYRAAGFATLPCRCDYEGCEGWAAVRPSGLLHHLLYCLPDRAAIRALDCFEDSRALEKAKS